MNIGRDAVTVSESARDPGVILDSHLKTPCISFWFKIGKLATTLTSNQQSASSMLSPHPILTIVLVYCMPIHRPLQRHLQNTAARMVMRVLKRFEHY